MLDYPPYTEEQQNGIARKDYTTLWDWLEFPKGKGFGLSLYPVKQKGIKEPIGDKARFSLLTSDRIIPNTKEAVPNNGMKSEKQSEYGVPMKLLVIRSMQMQVLCCLY